MVRAASPRRLGGAEMVYTCWKRDGSLPDGLTVPTRSRAMASPPRGLWAAIERGALFSVPSPYLSRQRSQHISDETSLSLYFFLTSTAGYVILSLITDN
jgi:hypothetical protein